MKKKYTDYVVKQLSVDDGTAVVLKDNEMDPELLELLLRQFDAINRKDILADEIAALDKTIKTTSAYLFNRLTELHPQLNQNNTCLSYNLDDARRPCIGQRKLTEEESSMASSGVSGQNISNIQSAMDRMPDELKKMVKKMLEGNG